MKDLLRTAARASRKLASLAVVGLAVLASVATLPTPPPPEWVEATDFELVVGQGWEEYDPYEAGEGLPLEPGFQGGQHVNVSLRAKGVEPFVDMNVTVWLVRAADDELLAGPETFTESFEDSLSGYDVELPEGVVALPWLRLLVEDPDRVVGEEVELRVQVDPGDGRTGRAWFRGTGEWGPAPWDEPVADAGTTDDAGAFDGGGP